MVRFIPDPIQLDEQEWINIISGTQKVIDIYNRPVSYAREQLDFLSRLPRCATQTVVSYRPLCVNLWSYKEYIHDKVYVIYIKKLPDPSRYTIVSRNGPRDSTELGGLSINSMLHTHGSFDLLEDALIGFIKLAKKKTSKQKDPYHLIGLWSKDYTLGTKARLLLETDYPHNQWRDIIKQNTSNIDLILRMKGLMLE